MYRELQCICCSVKLYGSLDTYGEPGAELCAICWNAHQDETEYQNMRRARWAQDGRGSSYEPDEYQWIEVR